MYACVMSCRLQHTCLRPWGSLWCWLTPNVTHCPSWKGVIVMEISVLWQKLLKDGVLIKERGGTGAAEVTEALTHSLMSWYYPFSPSTHIIHPSKRKIEKIIIKQGIDMYLDQNDCLWTSCKENVNRSCSTVFTCSHLDGDYAWQRLPRVGSALNRNSKGVGVFQHSNQRSTGCWDGRAGLPGHRVNRGWWETSCLRPLWGRWRSAFEFPLHTCPASMC